MPGDTNDHALKEILAKIETLRSPVIDPTANVLSLVAAAITRQDDLRSAEFKRQDDLRVQAEHFNDKISAERARSEEQARKAESGRIDALLAANTNNVALALEKQGAQAQAQDKRIAALEQNQYQGVGAGNQRLEGGRRNEWLIGIVIGAIVAIASILLRVLGK